MDPFYTEELHRAYLAHFKELYGTDWSDEQYDALRRKFFEEHWKVKEMQAPDFWVDQSRAIRNHFSFSEDLGGEKPKPRPVT